MPLIPKGTARIDARDGAYAAALLSDTGGLTQFGGFIETLPPCSASSTLHWHEKEDEMVHVLTGTVTLFASEAQTPMYPGDTACFKAAPPSGIACATIAILRPATWSSVRGPGTTT
jgi:uncharacterized cupin superfamily protein